MIEEKHIVETIQAFLNVNKGDDAAERLLICLGAEILDVSPDSFMENLDFSEKE